MSKESPGGKGRQRSNDWMDKEVQEVQKERTKVRKKCQKEPQEGLLWLIDKRNKEVKASCIRTQDKTEKIMNGWKGKKW